MKTLYPRDLMKSLTVAFLLTGFGAIAQMPGGAGGATGMNAVLTKLFGDVQGFTSKVDIQVTDKSNQELFSMPMDFAYLDKKLRIQMDLTKMKNSQMSAGLADTLKKMGMADVISIVRPDKNVTYTIYPQQNAALTMPLQDEAVTVKSRTPQGKETIDGHPCVKHQVVTVDGKGHTIEATTWNATDLKDFPVQIQTKEADNISYLRFKQVQLAKPESQQFELSDTYKKYTDPKELQAAVMKKMTEGMGQK